MIESLIAKKLCMVHTEYLNENKWNTLILMHYEIMRRNIIFNIILKENSIFELFFLFYSHLKSKIIEYFLIVWSGLYTIKREQINIF